ncbi:MAG: WecB/TagA/CpsF family glycosyltransferase [Clostridia bacterium]|nr:WecB/TagA/CpsF family glycosyltransferase [Clostridia bacterium]
MMDRIPVLGVNFDNVTMNEAIEKCMAYLSSENGNLVVTPNPEIVMRANEDSEFKDIINHAALVIPDGIGIIKGAKILGTPLKERVAGYDLICNLFDQGKDGSISFYFWGGKPGVAELAKEKIKEKYPELNVLGAHHGYFQEEEEKEIIEEIRTLKPDVLLVGLGFPKQEKTINKYLNDGIFKIGIGCGGSIDVIAGTVKRAPKFFIDLHLEWFYRLLKQPTRFKRMLVLPQFILEVKKSKK